MSLLVVAVAFLAALPAAHAQSGTFDWSFGNLSSAVSTLPQCSSYQIKLSPLSSGSTSVGKGPWTVLAYEAGGTPSVQAVGSDQDSLVWQVRHAVGTKLLVTMLDVNGGFGGFPDVVYTVSAGDTADCVPKTPAPTLSVTSNYTASDPLPTCAQWGLTVTGGTPPYALTIAALGAPIITNVTSTGKLNRFTYVNRASPGSAVIAGITDATGLWGVSSPLVSTSGGADTTCNNLISSWDTVPVSSSAFPSSTSSISSPAPSSAAASGTPSPVTTTTAHHSNTAAIAGGVVGGVAALVIAFLALFCLRRRAQRVRPVSNKKGPHSPPLGDVEKVLDLAAPAPDLPRDPRMPSPFPSATTAAPYLPTSRVDTGVSSTASLTSPVSRREGATLQRADDGAGASEASATLIAAPGLLEGRAARKAREAAEDARRGQEAVSVTPEPASPPVTGTDSSIVGPSGAPDTIFVQHRDGGVPDPVVVELPPAYADHRQQNQQIP